VYLIETASGGVEERCISPSREAPRSWGLAFSVDVSDEDGTLLAVASGPWASLPERGEERRRLAAGVSSSCSCVGVDPGPEGASDGMLGPYAHICFKTRSTADAASLRLEL
jgi:hypothetical protein